MSPRNNHLLLIVLILLFGFFLRTTDIGAAPLVGDEVSLSYLAFNFGHNGQRAELGIPSSAGIYQPPFFSDFFAIPYAFNPDPRIGRLFMGLLHLVSMAVLYLLVRRYWASHTALATLLIYAVLPRAVVASRYLWNAYLALPFIIFFLATGFLLSDGKRWARWLHPAMLACATGAYIIVCLIGVVSLGFYARDWIRSRKRRQLILDDLIGVAIAALILAPWAVGVIHQRASAPDTGTFYKRTRTPFNDLVAEVVSIPTYLDSGLLSIPNTQYSDPPPALVTIYAFVGWIALLSALFLVGRGIVKRRYPDLMIGLAYLIPPLILIFSPTHTYIHYLIALLPTTAIILAIALIGYRPRTSLILKRISTSAVVVICVLYLALVINVLQQVHNFQFVPGSLMVPIEDLIKLRNEAVRPGVETIYLIQGSSGGDYEQLLAWSILAVKGPSRVIWGDNVALPVPENGATILGYKDKSVPPELSAVPRLTLDNLYRVIDIPPHTGFTPTCQHTGPTRLSNGATILGYYAPNGSDPQPKQPWTIYVLWRGKANDQHTSYQMSNNLVDANGNRLAQNDVPTLATDLWHDSDLLISKVTLTATDKLPDHLSLRVGMYILPTATNPGFVNMNAVDDKGNPAGGWVTIAVCQLENTVQKLSF